jgi:HNH endonuclease
MAICIFCRGDGSSLEHVVAHGIGGRKTIDRMCKPCNSDFGARIDAKLVNHPLVQFERARLGIAGKSEVPQPLVSGRLADDPDVRVHNVVSDDRTGPQIQTGVIRSTNAAGQEVIRVVGASEEEVLEAANKVLKRDGHEPITLETLRAHAKATNDRPWIAVDIRASTVSFRPALVKIAYEVAWMALGEMYLDDPIGENVRTVLRDTSVKPEDLGTRLNATFAMLPEQPLVPFFQPSADVHTIALFVQERQLYAWVRIFRAFEAILPIAETPRRDVEKVITVDPVAGTWIEEPYEEALQRASGSL